MKRDNENHLDEKQLIQAVVDQTDLPASVQAHLAKCRQCQTSMESFERELANLGQMAERYAPQPQKRITLPVHETKSSFWNLLNWRNAIGAAAMVAAVLIVYWGTAVVRNLSEHGTDGLTLEMLEAERLMTQVNILVDNALPAFYLEISGEKNPDYDEEFYQFLIPPIEDQTLTSDSGKRGTSLC